MDEIKPSVKDKLVAASSKLIVSGAVVASKQVVDVKIAGHVFKHSFAGYREIGKIQVAIYDLQRSAEANLILLGVQDEVTAAKAKYLEYVRKYNPALAAEMEGSLTDRTGQRATV